MFRFKNRNTCETQIFFIILIAFFFCFTGANESNLTLDPQTGTLQDLNASASANQDISSSKPNPDLPSTTQASTNKSSNTQAMSIVQSLTAAAIGGVKIKEEPTDSTTELPDDQLTSEVTEAFQTTDGGTKLERDSTPAGVSSSQAVNQIANPSPKSSNHHRTFSVSQSKVYLAKALGGIANAAKSTTPTSVNPQNVNPPISQPGAVLVTGGRSVPITLASLTAGGVNAGSSQISTLGTHLKNPSVTSPGTALQSLSTTLQSPGTALQNLARSLQSSPGLSNTQVSNASGSIGTTASTSNPASSAVSSTSSTAQSTGNTYI